MSNMGKIKDTCVSVSLGSSESSGRAMFVLKTELRFCVLEEDQNLMFLFSKKLRISSGSQMPGCFFSEV